MSVLSRLTAVAGDSPARMLEPSTKTQPVRDGAELERIMAIPRKTLADAPDAALIERLVRGHRRDMVLRPIQLQALWEAWKAQGLLGPIAVGGGKTLICALLPTVLARPKAVVLTTAGLLNDAEQELKKYRSQFRIYESVRWISYSILSSPQQCTILDELQPDLIIADECHNLASMDAARTKRFLRYFKGKPDTLFCAMSGSIAASSILDFGHLARLALKQRTPLPRDYITAKEWSEALDVSKQPRPPGALLRLASSDDHDPSQTARARRGVRRRLSDTLGVVASSSNDIGVPLNLVVVETPKSPRIEKAVGDLKDSWCRPDGEELTTVLEFSRVYRQIRLGGFYRWVWPNDSVDVEWLQARAAYRSALRKWLAVCSTERLDSPFLVESALVAGSPLPRRGETETLRMAWREWFPLKDRPEPPTRWEWFTDRVVAWLAAKMAPRTIVWTEFRAVGEVLSRMGAVPFYGEGPEAAKDIIQETGDRAVVASMRAHSEGRNLQMFCNNVLAGAVSSGRRAEQLVGRTHRPGQTRTVNVELLDVFQEEWTAALQKAAFAQDLTGNSQKILTLAME